MKNSLLLAGAGLALGAYADLYDNYEYGNNFYLGPTTNGQYITKATYSMVPPPPPTDWPTANEDKTWLSLWIGVQNNPNNANVLEMSFVQPLLNWAPDNAAQGCSADVTHWCASASTYDATTNPAQQIGTVYKPVDTDATLDFEISINSSTEMIDQKIWMNGVLISTESDSKGMKPAVFYSGNECYYKQCGTLAEYSYTNITLVFNEAQENLNDLNTLTNATSTGFKTTDGGITWACDAITIAKDDL